MQSSIENDDILAYHDRSDGGLIATLAEMSFAGHVGITVDINNGDGTAESSALSALFNEELGAVIQVKVDRVSDMIEKFSLAGVNIAELGGLNSTDTVDINYHGERIFQDSRASLQSAWSETSFQVASLRDNAECVRQEFERATAPIQGLSANLTFDPSDDISAPYIATGISPEWRSFESRALIAI